MTAVHDTAQRSSVLARIAPLGLWLVYDHPPIARQFFVGASGVVLFTDDTIAAPDLDTLRRALARDGLQKIERDLRDDPGVIEAWA